MIWHLMPLPRWQSAGSGVFVPGTEDAAPFVHASPDEAVTLAVANDRFTGSPEPLVALALDESRLADPVRREPADPAPPPGTGSGTPSRQPSTPVTRVAENAPAVLITPYRAVWMHNGKRIPAQLR